MMVTRVVVSALRVVGTMMIMLVLFVAAFFSVPIAFMSFEHEWLTPAFWCVMAAGVSCVLVALRLRRWVPYSGSLAPGLAVPLSALLIVSAVVVVPASEHASDELAYKENLLLGVRGAWLAWFAIPLSLASLTEAGLLLADAFERRTRGSGVRKVLR